MTLTIKDKPNGNVIGLFAGQFFMDWRPNTKEVFVYGIDGSLAYGKKVDSVSVELNGVYVYEHGEFEVKE